MTTAYRTIARDRRAFRANQCSGTTRTGRRCTQWAKKTANRFWDVNFKPNGLCRFHQPPGVKPLNYITVYTRGKLAGRTIVDPVLDVAVVYKFGRARKFSEPCR